MAHLVLGLVRRAEGEHHGALLAFERAIELNRNLAHAYAQKGNSLTLVGRPAEAPPFVERAIRLSPYDPSIGVFQWIIGRALFFTDQYEEAIVWLRKSVEIRPNIWYPRLYLVSAYALADMSERATRALSEFNRIFANPVYSLSVVEARERQEPNDNPIAIAARAKFHEGLLRAGMVRR
jgi:adenylate cyclase